MPASCLSLEGQNDGNNGAGRLLLGDARLPVNETRLSIITAMEELDRPVTSAELYAMLDGAKPLAAVEYHLSTLVRAGFAELIIGPELSFRLATGVAVSPAVLRGRGAKAPPKLRNA